MVVNMESQSPKVDAVLLSIAGALFAIGMGAQYFFTTQSALVRFTGLLLTVGITVALISRTNLGRRMWTYWQDSVAELRKVVWPTKKETVQSTVAVLVMVFIMGVVLWSIDAILVRIMAWIVKQGAV